MTPYATLRKQVREALRRAETTLIQPSRNIPVGVTKWTSNYSFAYQGGRVDLTLSVDCDTDANSNQPVLSTSATVLREQNHVAQPADYESTS